MVANLQAGRSQNVSLFAVRISNQRDVCRSVGIVFDCLYQCRHAVFVAFEVNDSVFNLGAAAAVANGQFALIVSAGVLLQVNHQRFLGRGFCDFVKCGHCHVSSGWCIGFISLNCHLSSTPFGFLFVYTLPCVLRFCFFRKITFPGRFRYPCFQLSALR